VTDGALKPGFGLSGINCSEWSLRKERPLYTARLGGGQRNA
jgi:hypothetical protein